MDADTRRQMIFNVLTVNNDVTAATEINTIGSSANLAFEWLVGDDELYLCPDDMKIIQRYVVGKIYFQTNGDSWDHCSRPSSSTNLAQCNPAETSPEGPLQGQPWLDASHECDWAFIRCRPDNCITHIEVGEYIVKA